MTSGKTIFALSSGGLPSGVAIVRVSGPGVRFGLETICGFLPESRQAVLTKFRHPVTRRVLDEGLVLYFQGPRSFTGEDCAELQIHGGVGVVDAVLEALSALDDFVMAEAGEFSRRAFDNGKMDLTEAEGLADLISAQTEGQRRQALLQSGGGLKVLYENWRQELVRLRAYIEAEIDFADEDDVPGSVSDQVWDRVVALSHEIDKHLDDGRAGEIIRDGLRVVLLGAPNAGKSSLLNALAERDVAIVSNEPGTTRDVLDVTLNLGGLAVIVSDTAGQRENAGALEAEGMRRALLRADDADLKLWLIAPGDRVPESFPVEPDLIVFSKSDEADQVASRDFSQHHLSYGVISCSVVSENGLVDILDFLKAEALRYFNIAGNETVVTRSRHRNLLSSCSSCLKSVTDNDTPIELRAEFLRSAGDDLGRITGKIDVEELLGSIFSEFCVGK